MATPAPATSTPQTLLQRIELCIELAENRTYAGCDDLSPEWIRDTKISTFIASLSGVLQRDDMAIANRIFALLALPKKEASQ